MKLKDGFILGNIAGENVVIASGDELDLNLMSVLNDTGKFIWEQLEQETTEEKVVEAILAEYDVDRQTAADCVTAFVEKLRARGFLEE